MGGHEDATPMGLSDARVPVEDTHVDPTVQEDAERAASRGVIIAHRSRAASARAHVLHAGKPVCVRLVSARLTPAFWGALHLRQLWSPEICASWRCFVSLRSLPL